MDINLNVLPDSVENAVLNMTDEPTKSIGETLSDIWFLVFGGIHQSADKRKIRYAHELDEFQNSLNNKIKEIPPQKIVEPKIQVVAPALENAKYCIEEKELRELFENLITASMNKDTSDQVHPAFADILKRMSPRDASNIASFGNVNNYPIAQYQHIIGNGFVTNMQYVFLQNKNFTDLHKQSESISILITLGLVDVNWNKRLNDYSEFYKTEEYKIFKDLAEQANMQNIEYLEQINKQNIEYLEQPNLPEVIQKLCNQKHDLMVIEGSIELTPMGSLFKSICMPNS